MTCFNPNLMKCTLDKETGALNYTFEGSAKLTDPREYGTIDDLATRGYYYLTIPCGHCLGCNIDYSRRWANRMILELKENPKAIFLTLTYRDGPDLPKTEFSDPELNYRDVQLFWKRLRKAFPDRRIRFFLAGEYGPKTLRPHYHAIVYGIDRHDFPDAYVQKYNKINQPLFDSPRLAGIWSHGYILFSDVTWHTCAYVSRYVLKKHYGAELSDLEGRTPEFNQASRKPGIGLSDYESYILSDMTHFTVDGRDGCYQIPIPKEFLRKAKKDGVAIDKINALMYDRAKQAHDSLLTSLHQFDDRSYKDYLENQEAALLNKIRCLEPRQEGGASET